MKKLVAALVLVAVLGMPAVAMADPRPRATSVSVSATIEGDQVSLAITADLPDHGKPRDVSAYALEGGMWCLDTAGVPVSIETHGTDINMNSLPVPDTDPIVLTSGPFTIPGGAASCRAFVWFFPDIYTELVSIPIGV